MIDRFLTASIIAVIALTSGSALSHQTEGQDPVDPEVKCGANVVEIDSTYPDPLITDPVTAYGKLYVDLRDVAGFAPAPVGHDGNYTYSIWIYAEANDHPGMQTKANTPSDLDSENVENCGTAGHSKLGPDLLIF